MNKSNALTVDDVHVRVRFKLFALWASVIFFYVYGDYFEPYQPETLSVA